MKIHKYKVDISDFSTPICVRKGYKIVHVGLQGGNIYAWILFDQHEEDKRFIRLWVFGTGHLIPNNLTFVQTVQDKELGLVWHVFEGKND